MFPTLEATWTGAVGENASYGQCYLDGYLYVVVWATPGKVIKIDPAIMTTVDSWTGTANQVSSRYVETDGTYIYVGCSSAGGMWVPPSRVVKIDPTTMTTVGEWIGEDPPPVWPDQCNPEKIVYDGTNIYVIINFNGCARSARLVKIDPTTMMTIGQWDGVGIQYGALGLTLFGNYAYVSCSDVPARIVKVDKATMTTISEWVGDISDGGWIEGLIWGLTNDGTYLYAATYDYMEESPLRLIKIDVATMTSLDKYIGDPDEMLGISCIYESVNNHVYIGPYGYPNDTIVRVDPSTMTKVDRWMRTGDYHTIMDFSISSNPKYLFASLWTSPGSVLKFELPGPTSTPTPTPTATATPTPTPTPTLTPTPTPTPTLTPTPTPTPTPPPEAKGGSGTLLPLAKMLMG